MKKIAFIFLCLPFFVSCNKQQPCNTVNLAEKDYLNVKFGSFTGIGGFVANGYSRFEVLEVNQSFPTDYNAYYDTKYSPNPTSLKLPIAHNYLQTTFVFKGDTVSPETLMVNNYNARAELTDECGYRLTIDKPNIGYFTFSQKTSNPEFDETNKILKLQITK